LEEPSHESLNKYKCAKCSETITLREVNRLCLTCSAIYKCEHCLEKPYYLLPGAKHVTLEKSYRLDTIVCKNCFRDKYERCPMCHSFSILENFKGIKACILCLNKYEYCSKCQDIFRKEELVGGLCMHCLRSYG